MGSVTEGWAQGRSWACPYKPAQGCGDRRGVGDAVGAHVDGEDAHRRIALVGAVVRPVHRFHERVARLVGARALVAVIDRQLAVEHVAEQRHGVFVPAGLAAGRDGDDDGRHLGRSRRIGDRLVDDRPAGFDQRRDQRLVGDRLLGKGGSRRESGDQGKGRDAEHGRSLRGKNPACHRTDEGALKRLRHRSPCGRPPAGSPNGSGREPWRSGRSRAACPHPW